ncbi:hypothetical protein DRB17_11420 [Ferruginivarius sediminum]|uniref:Copper resistance protein D domain-containing protein n=2 Tax=Ferruginivarius sediminum TaxID=2661937 RepID=A0A369T945_9PROT|nr:hypothetical protein DRB17_11420 [Ferruginivarius sediminum]
MTLALALHALAAVVWVGGMAFAYWFVRPAAGVLEGPDRQRLWRGIFARFFPLVWLSILILLASGYHMLFAGYGGFAGAGLHIHVMQGLGILMVLIFAHVYFAPWRRFRQAVDAGERETGARNLEQIRRFVGINLGLGLVLVAIASSGRYWP